MISIKAFQGYRPPASLVKKVAAVPYDVISIDEAKQLAQNNPQSFLHITRSEIDLPGNDGIYSQAVYNKAKSSFLEFVEKGWLIKDHKESIYIYRQQMDDHIQTGILTLSSVQDYFEGKIKKHEFTRPVKEQDRINNMNTTGIHSGPVFLTYKNVDEINNWVAAQIDKHNPTYHFTANDNITHTLWCITEQTQIEHLVQLFKTKVPASYIADGHHRAASGAKVGRQLAQENPNHKGDESYNFFLSVLFPDNEMKILDYNRLVKNLNGLTKEQFLKQVEQDFYVAPIGIEIFKPDEPRCFSLYLDNKWYRLQSKPHTFNENDPIDTLDITTLSNCLLDKILDIKDQRTDDRIDFVGGIRGLGELKKRVDSGDWQLAIALYPVTVQQLINIADSGQVMPPKSTWFEPKLRSGLVVHQFE